jgi:hypothetical protein
VLKVLKVETAMMRCSADERAWKEHSRIGRRLPSNFVRDLAEQKYTLMKSGIVW